MKGEFIRVLASDGLELQGIFAPARAGASDTSVLHVHGLAGNFYENRFVDNVAGAVTSQGMNFLTVNNRGHDYISDFIVEEANGTTGSVQIGGIYEIFEDCLKDIAAWADFLRSRGTKKIILEGHSHGALKVTYYACRKADPDIAGMILLSPSDDFGCQHERIGDAFDEALKVAKDMVGRGAGRELMPPRYFHYPVAAQTYLDIFTPGSALGMFNVSGTDRTGFQELESVRVPVLALVGSVDEAFLGSPGEYLDAIKARLTSAPGFEGGVIEGAPHNYQGFDAEVAGRIGEWLAASFG